MALEYQWQRQTAPSEWVQPTGEPDRCTQSGQTWKVTQADGAGNNIWQPGEFGWEIQP